MRALIALFALGLIVIAGVLVGCPPNLQCTSQNDCPIGQNCSAQSKCVPAPPPPPPKDAGFRGGEGEGEGGEGEGEGGPAATAAFAQGTITMFVPNSATQALVGVLQPSDSIITFDTVAATFNTAPVFDFQNTTGGSCGIDTVFQFTATQVGAGSLDGGKQKETWFSCSLPSPHVIIEYDNDTGNLFSNSGVASAELTRILGPYHNDGLSQTKTARIVAAARGGTTLQIFAIDNSADQVAHARTPETITGVTFSSVEAIFVLAQDDPQAGDVLLIFDRGAHQLIPIQREPSLTTWHGAPLQAASPKLKPLAVPTDVDAVIVLDDLTANRSSTSTAPTQLIDLNGLSTAGSDDDTANLVYLRPTHVAAGINGEVDFARLEKELNAGVAFTPGTSGFVAMSLGAAGTPPPKSPLPGDRTLLQLVPNGADTLVFYALTESPHVWQFRLPHSRADVLTAQNVQRATLLRQSDTPNGLVLIPNVFTGAWISFSSASGPAVDKEVDFVPFGPAF